MEKVTEKRSAFFFLFVCFLKGRGSKVKTGLLTEDFEHGGGIADPGGTGGHLAVVDQLVERLHGGDVQREALVDGDASRQMRPVVVLLLTDLRAERHALPVSRLLLLDRGRGQEMETEKKLRELRTSIVREGRVDARGALTMYHSTKLLLDAGETLKVQGSLAKLPFSTSTLSGTVTVTAPRHPGGETRSRRSEKAYMSDVLHANERIRRTSSLAAM